MMSETKLYFSVRMVNRDLVSYKGCKVYKSTVSVGANVMLINGLPVDVTSLELYELMDRISAEVTPIHRCLLLQSMNALLPTK